MRRQMTSALLVTIVLTVMFGLMYPLVVTGVAQVAFGHRANGSIIRVNGKDIGSSLIGQSFVDHAGNPLAQYFQSRPSAAGTNGYDPTASGASNLGPSSATLLDQVAKRAVVYRQFNGLAADAPVPVDAVTASASGLDPDISVANALDQAGRVAAARHVSVQNILALINRHTNSRPWGILGETTVNVLDLNLALDRSS